MLSRRDLFIRSHFTSDYFKITSLANRHYLIYKQDGMILEGLEITENSFRDFGWGLDKDLFGDEDCPGLFDAKIMKLWHNTRYLIGIICYCRAFSSRLDYKLLSNFFQDTDTFIVNKDSSVSLSNSIVLADETIQTSVIIRTVAPRSKNFDQLGLNLVTCWFEHDRDDNLDEFKICNQFFNLPDQFEYLSRNFKQIKEEGCDCNNQNCLMGRRNKNIKTTENIEAISSLPKPNSSSTSSDISSDIKKENMSSLIQSNKKLIKKNQKLMKEREKIISTMENIFSHGKKK